MSSLNRVLLIGNLGDEPKLDVLSNGAKKVTLKVATTEKGYTTKSGAVVADRTEWHTVIVWEKIAEFCKNFLHKGSLVYVEGVIHSSSWQTESGETRYATSIDGKHVQSLERRPASNSQEGQASQGNQEKDDDMPF